MKYVLCSICLVLCFFAVSVEADEPGTFGMRNSNGDSAFCKMTSPFDNDDERNAQFKRGEKQRRGFFNDESFRKIIEKTEQGKNFECDLLTYKKIQDCCKKMKDCQLIYKSESSEAEKDQPSNTPSIDVSEGLSTNQPPRLKKTSSNQVHGVHEEEEQMPQDTSWKNAAKQPPFPKFYIAIGGLVLIVLLIYGVVKIFSKNKADSGDMFSGIRLGAGEGEIGRSRNNRITMPKGDELARLQDEVTRLRNDVAGKANLENDVQFLRKEIESLKKGSMSTDAIAPNPVQAVVETVNSIVNNAIPTDTFFFAGPIENTFDASRKADEFSDGKLYKFERVRGSNRAQFVVVDGYESVVQRFVYSPELQTGVCDVIGNYNPNASRIQTDEPGEAVLDGDTWVVGKKAKIRYC
jgi:hypothetical protein